MTIPEAKHTVGDKVWVCDRFHANYPENKRRGIVTAVEFIPKGRPFVYSDRIEYCVFILDEDSIFENFIESELKERIEVED